MSKQAFQAGCKLEWGGREYIIITARLKIMNFEGSVLLGHDKWTVLHDLYV